MRCVIAAIPLILKYQGTGRIYAITEEERYRGSIA